MKVEVCSKCENNISPHDPIFETVVKGDLFCFDCADEKPKLQTMKLRDRWYSVGDNGKPSNEKEEFTTGNFRTRKEAETRGLEIMKILFNEDDPIEED